MRATRDQPYRDAATGETPRHWRLDLYTPVMPDGCGPAPIVVYVHGGAFFLGDKANKVENKVRLARRNGWALASLNYRLAPDPFDDRSVGHRHPAPVRDIAAALAWLRAHGERRGLDRRTILLVGHSSGAFLVALAATDRTTLRRFDVPPRSVRCAVSLDTGGFDIPDQVAFGGFRATMFRNAFGDDPRVWRDASPSRLVRRSTGAHVPDFLLVSRGSQTRIDTNREFARAVRSAGASAGVVDARPLSHEAVNEALGMPGDDIVTPRTQGFLQRCAGPDGGSSRTS